MVKFVQNHDAKKGALKLGTSFWTFKLLLVVLDLLSGENPLEECLFVIPAEDGCEYGSAVRDCNIVFVVFCVVAGE